MILSTMEELGNPTTTSSTSPSSIKLVRLSLTILDLMILLNATSPRLLRTSQTGSLMERMAMHTWILICMTIFLTGSTLTTCLLLGLMHSAYSSTILEIFTNPSILLLASTTNTLMVTKELTSSPFLTTMKLMNSMPSGIRESILYVETSLDHSLKQLMMLSKLRQLTLTWQLTNTL